MQHGLLHKRQPCLCLTQKSWKSNFLDIHILMNMASSSGFSGIWSIFSYIVKYLRYSYWKWFFAFVIMFWACLKAEKAIVCLCLTTAAASAVHPPTYTDNNFHQSFTLTNLLVQGLRQPHLQWPYCWPCAKWTWLQLW